MMGAMSKMIPHNQLIVVDKQAINERWQAEDYLLKHSVKLNAKQCADYCSYFFANIKSGRLIRKNTVLLPVPKDMRLMPVGWLLSVQGMISEKMAITPFLVSQRVKMPKSSMGWLPVKMRLECVTWWTRQLKKRDMREAEQGRIASHKVQKYCSDKLLLIMQQQQLRLAEWLARTTIESESGECLELAKVAQASIANPCLRRNELMVRIKGMEQHASIFGHCGRFITATAPSKMHRSKGKDWNGYDPKQVQSYLVETWAKVRAKLARQKIAIYGVRVTEPHKDACPHWHLLAWFETTKQAKIGIKTIRHYFLQADGQESGALFNRVKTVTINPMKGGAASYVAKYVCKNVDGAHVDTMTDIDGQAVTDGKDGAARVKAWASCWGARQFQFVGGAPIGLWRELRRNRTGEGITGAMFILWSLADSADYCGFMIAYNYAKGEGIKPSIKKHKFIDDLKALAVKFGGVENIPDGDITKLTTLNKYQEPTSKVIGVVMGSSEIRTRSGKKWTIKTETKKSGFLSPQDVLEAYAVSRGAAVDISDMVNVAFRLGVFSGSP